MAESAPRPPGLSIFFPAYNDGGTIASLVMRMRLWSPVLFRNPTISGVLPPESTTP